MKKYKVSIVGNLSLGEQVYNGQTVKTRDYLHYISNRYSKDKVSYLDTQNWKKNIFKNIFRLFKLMFRSETVVLVLASNGRKTILPFVTFFRKLFNVKVIFSVVGGSLLYEYDKEKRTQKCMRKIDAVLVETKKFLEFLVEKGYQNAYYAPVFSKREIVLEKADILNSCNTPFRFCTYSRVCKEKGTTSAINAVLNINAKLGYKACELDIFGHPQPEYAEEFKSKLDGNEDVIHSYPYLVDENALLELSKHYMMLFPTFYEGEGFPIAIVECLKACVPVIASDWHFNSEVVVNNKTGIIYDLEEHNGLEKCIEQAISNPDKILEMKENCLEEVKKYAPDEILKMVYQIVESEKS